MDQEYFNKELKDLMYGNKNLIKYIGLNFKSVFAPVRGVFAMWKIPVSTGKPELIVFDPNLVVVGGRIAMAARIAANTGDTRRLDAGGNASPFMVSKFMFGDEGHEPLDITQGRVPTAMQTKLFCTQDSGKCPVIMKNTGDSVIPAQYEILDLGAGIAKTQVRFWSTVAANEGNGSGSQIYSEAGLVTGFATGTAMPGTRAYCEVDTFNRLAITAIDVGAAQNAYTIELTDTVLKGNETVTWTANTLVIEIEDGVSTIGDILTAALTPTGTPWAYLTDASGNLTTTVNSHAPAAISAYPRYIAGTANPHNYDATRNIVTPTDLKDYNPSFDLMFAIKTFGVITKTSEFALHFTWTLVF